jgi:hypothetical protein
VECELVNAHKKLGLHAERYPLSGASHFRGQGHDLDIYLFGKDEAPAVAESKSRKDGGGFATLERWLSDYDILFLKRDRQEPLVVLPWRVWARLIAKEEDHGKTHSRDSCARDNGRSDSRDHPA